MSATFTWTVNQMIVVPQVDGKTQVVIDANWTCTGSQQNQGVVVTKNVFGSAQFELDPSSNFTPYSQLTQDQVLGWIWSTDGVKTQAEQNVQDQIDEEIARPQVSPPLPWIQPIPPAV
jgi:hypothetical protein